MPPSPKQQTPPREDGPDAVRDLTGQTQPMGDLVGGTVDVGKPVVGVRGSQDTNHWWERGVSERDSGVES